MPLYIRDDDVDALAMRLQSLTRSKTKTEAVRLALEHEIRRQTDALLPSERIGKAKTIVADIRAEAKSQGLHGESGAFDMKAFTDELWGT